MIDVDLTREGLTVSGQMFKGSVLPSLLAALLYEHLDGRACEAEPSTRARLQARMRNSPELHRTQLWRAFRRLENTLLRGLMCAGRISSGPFWLDRTILARCRFSVLGKRADAASLAQLLDAMPGTSCRATVAYRPDFNYVEALARADYLFDRGELFPARQALEDAAACVPGADALSHALLCIRRARIARRLADWANLHDELRELGRYVREPSLSAEMRLNLQARLHILSAWHVFGSLGNAQAALAGLERMDEGGLGTDWALHAEYSSLRGLVLRDMALASGRATLAAESVECLGQAVRHASLAGRPDGLQSVTANFANTMATLHEAGLLAGDPTFGIIPALRWLLLSESICRRWQIGCHSLLNMVFLLRLAADNQLCLGELKKHFPEYVELLHGEDFAALAAHAWESCRQVHSQIPADQRCAFMMMWAWHAGMENDRVTALELCTQVLAQRRKLRDVEARRRYADAVAELRGRLTQGLRV